MRFITIKKEQILHLPNLCSYFSLQTLEFLLEGAQKYFLPQGAGYPSYATGFISDATPSVRLSFTSLNRCSILAVTTTLHSYA